MHGIDLLDVPDIAELPYEELVTILDDPMVKSKLDAIHKREEEQRAADELEEEKKRNGTNTPAEVTELKRVKKQKQRLEQLNLQIEAERAELQHRLDEVTKNTDKLSKDYAHARRESLHFANEAMQYKAQLASKAQEATVPEQLNMSRVQAATFDSLVNAAPVLDDRDDTFDGTPEEVSKRIQVKIAFQKRTLARLEQELTKFKNGDPSAGKQRLPSSWAFRGDVEAMKAQRQQKILEATKKRAVSLCVSRQRQHYP